MLAVSLRQSQSIPPAMMGIWNVTCWADFICTAQIGGNPSYRPCPYIFILTTSDEPWGTSYLHPHFPSPHHGSPVCFLGIHLTVRKANKTETLGKTSSPKSLLLFGEN